MNGDHTDGKHLVNSTVPPWPCHNVYSPALMHMRKPCIALRMQATLSGFPFDTLCHAMGLPCLVRRQPEALESVIVYRWFSWCLAQRARETP